LHDIARLKASPRNSKLPAAFVNLEERLVLWDLDGGICSLDLCGIELLREILLVVETGILEEDSKGLT